MYEVVVFRRARNGTSRIPARDRERVFAVFRALAEDPRPWGARKMQGTGNLEEWRVRIGDYRVVYRVDDDARQVLVLAAGHRGSVYG